MSKHRLTTTTAKPAALIDHSLDWFGRRLAGSLTADSAGYAPFTPSDFDTLFRVLRPEEVIPAECRKRISTAIRYLTQSTWSHAAMHVDTRFEPSSEGAEPHRLVEVNLGEGCISAPLSKYVRHNTWICRPVGLSSEECRAATDFTAVRIGLSYNMRQIMQRGGSRQACSEILHIHHHSLFAPRGFDLPPISGSSSRTWPKGSIRTA